ncbi:Uncharacterised protein [Mycobacterium tuberculosis]|nr:Uncharacterised protein [Mycobacterium tuberculosis]
MPRCTTSAVSVGLWTPAVLSVNHRYLPRRSVPLIRAPRSRAVRSAGPASWRRTARGWCTRTSVMVRPVT